MSLQRNVSLHQYLCNMFILLSLIAILIATLYLYLTRNFEYWTRRGIHGPKPYPYVGTYPKTYLYQTATQMSETSDIYWKYFRKHRFVGVFESGDPKLLILDPALVSDIYVKYYRNFTENSIRELVNIGRSSKSEWEAIQFSFTWWISYLRIFSDRSQNGPIAKIQSVPSTKQRMETLSYWANTGFYSSQSLIQTILQYYSNSMEEARLMLAFYLHTQVKSTYPIIETSCQRLVEYLNNRIDAGETDFNSQDVWQNSSDASGVWNSRFEPTIWFVYG